MERDLTLSGNPVKESCYHYYHHSHHHYHCGQGKKPYVESWGREVGVNR